jgi:hypothetical protein
MVFRRLKRIMMKASVGRNTKFGENGSICFFGPYRYAKLEDVMAEGKRREFASGVV